MKLALTLIVSIFSMFGAWVAPVLGHPYVGIGIVGVFTLGIFFSNLGLRRRTEKKAEPKPVAIGAPNGLPRNTPLGSVVYYVKGKRGSARLAGARLLQMRSRGRALITNGSTNFTRNASDLFVF